MAEKPYDLLVLGAGPGGYVAAIRAAQLGMRVACVDKDASLGGTCLNIGCIPSKALLDSSERFHQAGHDLAEHGISVGPPALDLAKMMARKQKVVKTLTKGIAGLFRKNGVTAFTGAARILSPSEVSFLLNNKTDGADSCDGSATDAKSVYEHRSVPDENPQLSVKESNV